MNEPAILDVINVDPARVDVVVSSEAVLSSDEVVLISVPTDVVVDDMPTVSEAEAEIVF